jgi:hypothetical protein
LCIYPTCPQIVPTEYTTRLGTLLETSQYSVSEYAMPLLPPGETGRHGRRDPFVDLVYDLSPIVMRIHQSPLSLAHFVVRLCAVVGGALSVTRLADGLVHGVVRALGLSQEGRRVSSGGGRSSTGGGSVHSAAYCGDGLLPTRSSNPGSSHRSSLGGSLSGFVGALARHNSGGSGGGGGSSSIAGRLSGGGGGSAGGLLPTHASSGGGGGAAAAAAARAGSSVLMSPLSGFAPPALSGFGSWSQLDGGAPPNKKL